MDDRFACQIFFLYDPKIPEQYVYKEGRILSTSIPMEQEGANIERDVFKPIVVEDQRTKLLRQGIWKVFITGLVYRELDKETGDADYVFVTKPEDVIFVPLALQPIKNGNKE